MWRRELEGCKGGGRDRNVERREEEKRPGIASELEAAENKERWRGLAALHGGLQSQLVTLFSEANHGSSSSCENSRVSLGLLWCEGGISSKCPGPWPFQRMRSLCFGLMARCCSSACSDHSLPLPSFLHWVALPSPGKPVAASKVVWSLLRSSLFLMRIHYRATSLFPAQLPPLMTPIIQ